jgi:(p)ppGpp synthase/HD superfamily hydrolase
MGINMTEINITSKDGVMEGYIELQVQDRHNLEVMLAGLQKIDGVQSVVRTDIQQK